MKITFACESNVQKVILAALKDPSGVEVANQGAESLEQQMDREGLQYFSTTLSTGWFTNEFINLSFVQIR